MLKMNFLSIKTKFKIEKVQSVKLQQQQQAK